MNVVEEVLEELRMLANPARAKVLAGFFKTGKGEYGEGDVFYGVTVPQARSVAKKYAGKVILSDVDELLRSAVHEERLTALLVLVHKFQKGGEGERKRIYSFYLRNAPRVNNWDLVDLTADKIVGAFLEGRDKSVLRKLAKSTSLWERRIAIIATFHEISRGDSGTAFEIAEILLKDAHDLIQKAVGWMLREAGKRCSQEELEIFLDKHAAEMPRTMLRYAVEKLPDSKRREYLNASRAPALRGRQSFLLRVFLV